MIFNTSGFAKCFASASLCSAIILIDQWTKSAAISRLFDNITFIELCGIIIRGALEFNPGISFGIFSSNSIILTYLIAIVLLWTLYFAWKKNFPFGLSMIFAGGIGNFIDRLKYGAVVDFLSLSLCDINMFIFNIADAAISIGGVMLFFNAIMTMKFLDMQK